jgi:ribosomal protein S18 acetylase RimI-like enzyme
LTTAQATPSSGPIEVRPLTGVPFEQIFEAFSLGFSDYVVPFQPSIETLQEMLTRRGFVASLSVGAFDGDRLVGITLNGVDGNRAYDSGTAVIPTHRRRGLSSRMMQMSFSLLASRTYVLEVLQQNTPAVALYESLGFQHTRPFQVWSFTAEAPTRTPELANADLDLIRSWCDVEPSWQNDVPSLRRARESHVVLGSLDAAAVLFPHKGDLPLLAVAPHARRQGLGRALLNAAATRADKPLRILNVDDRNTGLAEFLEKCGATRGPKQFEMVRTL